MRRVVMLRLFRWVTAKLADGDPRAVVKLLADDVEFVFPGSSSWATHTYTKAELEAWLTRFAAMRPVYEVLDVMVSGPPWNMNVAVRMRDSIGDHYSNDGMHYMKLRWGKAYFDQVFIDTEKVLAFDADLAATAGGS